MTEDEAKTKWCPYSVVSRPILDTTRTWGGYHPRIGAESSNRGCDPEETRCIAAACMAWRQDISSRVWRLNSNGSKAYSFAAADPRQFENDAQFAVEPPGASGFCGLAGAPQ